MTTQTRDMSRPLLSQVSNLLRREYIFALMIAAILLVLAVLGNQVVDRLAALREASQDNAQWNLAQLDVELLALESASRQANDNTPESLTLLRRRFDVYFSRVNSVGRMTLFTEKLVQQESIDSLAQIRAILDRTAPIIDGPDISLRAQLKDISAATQAMRPLARQIGLEGVRIYATQSDAKREEFAGLLGRTAIVNGILILALGTVLLFLGRQIRISRLRTTDLKVISDRNESTVNAALDAIIVVNMDGDIVEFNPAATRIFGYTRNAAVGKKLDALIIPERYRDGHRQGMARYKKSGAKKVIDAGRVQMSALKSDGSEFPVEFSLGVTQASNDQLVIAFLRDISERVEQDQALRTARDEAVEAAKAKSQFLAIMSHEMRTPLNGVMAVLDLLDATRLDDRQKTYVKTATTSAEILKQHVDDVLDLTRLQAGKLDFFPRAFDVVELLEEVENINLATAAARNNKITLSVDLPQPYFVADRKRVHQVLTNLVGNAIKFTENGQIAIAATIAEVRDDVVLLEFSITDSGVGIAEEHQASIFEDFVTLDGSYQRSSAGTGLGLPICRSIVEAMAGIIGVKSHPGKGSTFWFRVPLKAAFAADKKPILKTVAIPPALHQHELNVLVVEDNETNRFVAGEMLRGANCNVVLAADGREGAAMAEVRKFDIIFMDLSMPRMNGWDAARLIRSSGNAKSHATPIYALTAHALPEEQKALIDAGMQGCILKPLRARELSEVLSTVRASLNVAPLVQVEHAKRFPPPVDMVVINELRDVLGNEVFAEKIGIFVDELKQLPVQLNAQLASNAMPDLGKLAHKFAGSAALFGAKGVSEKLRAAETAVKSKAENHVAQIVRDVCNFIPDYVERYEQLAAELTRR